jgi:hypothetical protein
VYGRNRHLRRCQPETNARLHDCVTAWPVKFSKQTQIEINGKVQEFMALGGQG